MEIAYKGKHKIGAGAYFKIFLIGLGVSPSISAVNDVATVNIWCNSWLLGQTIASDEKFKRGSVSSTNSTNNPTLLYNFNL